MSYNDHSRIENLSSLCEHLGSERLLVASELNTLQNLNLKVENDFLELYKLIWVCRHERVINFNIIKYKQFYYMYNFIII